MDSPCQVLWPRRFWVSFANFPSRSSSAETSSGPTPFLTDSCKRTLFQSQIRTRTARAGGQPRLSLGIQGYRVTPSAMLSVQPRGVLSRIPFSLDITWKLKAGLISTLLTLTQSHTSPSSSPPTSRPFIFHSPFFFQCNWVLFPVP